MNIIIDWHFCIKDSLKTLLQVGMTVTVLKFNQLSGSDSTRCYCMTYMKEYEGKLLCAPVKVIFHFRTANYYLIFL